MTWVKCIDGLPTKQGDILVKINGNLFLGYVYPVFEYPFSIKTDFILCLLPSCHPGTPKWSLPKHFREPDEWMYVP